MNYGLCATKHKVDHLVSLHSPSLNGLEHDSVYSFNIEEFYDRIEFHS